MQTRVPLRWTRAGVLAAASVLLAAAAHSLAGGPAVRPGVALVGTAVLTAALRPLLRRELRGPGLFAVVLALQAGLHLALMQPWATGPAGGLLGWCGAASGHAGMTGDRPMLLGHVAAALVVAWVLRLAERAVTGAPALVTAALVTAVLSRARAALRLGAPRPVRLPARAAPVAAAEPRALRPRWAALATGRRGPPAALA